VIGRVTFHDKTRDLAALPAAFSRLSALSMVTGEQPAMKARVLRDGSLGLP